MVFMMDMNSITLWQTVVFFGEILARNRGLKLGTPSTNDTTSGNVLMCYVSLENHHLWKIIEGTGSLSIANGYTIPEGILYNRLQYTLW